MSRPRTHVFVCQNQRAPGSRPCCGARGGAEVLAALQRRLLQDPDLAGSVSATGCACLGPCFDGPMVVVYPDGVWYRGVRQEDVEEIAKAHLGAGQPVERLRYEWPED